MSAKAAITDALGRHIRRSVSAQNVSVSPRRLPPFTAPIDLDIDQPIVQISDPIRA
jgi:hypothetical protein